MKPQIKYILLVKFFKWAFWVLFIFSAAYKPYAIYHCKYINSKANGDYCITS